MALSACQYCGRQNEAGAQFCSDCGKPLTKAAAARAAVAAGGGGGGVVSRTSGPGSPGGAPADAPCPLCGSMVTPHGTAGWHNATLTDDFASSLTDVTFAGLLGGTATSMMFLAKFRGPDASPAVTTWSMFFVDAEANTSAGAPLVIWVARVELAPKLNCTVSPGLAASNCFPS